MKFFLIASMLIPSVIYAQDCSTLIGQSESLFDSGDLTAAKSKAIAAIAACDKQKIKNARHYMVLASASFKEKNYEGVIKWSKEGLKQEPGLALAYMNMCAAYYGMKKYDEGIKNCEAGLKVENEWSARINTNLGMAYFNKAVEAEKFNEALKSEKYFLESLKIDPSIGMNHFYLGTLEFGVKGNVEAARIQFKKGCDLKDSQSCDSLATLPASQPKSAPPAKAGKTKDLSERLVKNYVKKGIPEVQARTTVNDLLKSLSAMPQDQQLTALESMVKATE